MAASAVLPIVLLLFGVVPPASAEALIHLLDARTHRSSSQITASIRGAARQQRTVSGNNVSAVQLLSSSHSAETAQPAISAIAAASSPPAEDARVVNLQQTVMAAPSASAIATESIVSKLRGELQELKQHRTNVAQMQQALVADVALLRESSTLQKVSATPRSHATAQLQVRKTEKLVKDLSGMLRDSRTADTEEAKDLLQEANEIRAAADALASEASSQLRAAAAGSAHRGHKHTLEKRKDVTEPAAEPSENLESTEGKSIPESPHETEALRHPAATVVGRDVDDIESSM